jgi:serine/threonine-protein kinase
VNAPDDDRPSSPGKKPRKARVASAEPAAADPELATTLRFEKGARSVREERVSSPDPWDDRRSSVPGERQSLVAGQQRLGSTVATRWKLVRLLGHGAAGAVFEGVDLETKERVAIKVLHDRHARSKDQCSRLMREARAIRAVAHPGVVEVFDAGRDKEGHVYIAFELLDGEDLHTAMSRGGLTTAQLVEIGRQLLQVLAAAHKKHVLHRDVKPENIFLQRTTDGSIRLKLLDFGIAKLTDAKGSVSTLDGITLGTPYYMSPEQCRGEKLSPQADVWSAGAVLFHVFAGRPPFDDERLGRLLERIVTERAMSLEDLRPDLPPRLVSAIDRALEPRLADRWPTAQTMAAALATYSLPLPSLDIE